MSLGERLAQVRKNLGWTQVDLAVALGDSFPQSMISMIETGRKKMSLQRGAEIATELQTSLDYLAGLTDDPTPAAARNKHAQEVEVPQEGIVFKTKRKGRKPAKKSVVTPEEAVENYRLIMEQSSLHLMAKRGTLSVEDMADIAGFIRDVRAEEREQDATQEGE